MTISEFADERPIDYSAIEKSLADLWRGQKEDENAVTRAALWNVIAHTSNATDHSRASQTLARASESVPQRAIVIRADSKAPSEISSWISANCHRISDEKQVCSEEISIVAGGARVRHVPPLMNALLIPDMPVAVWWLGDLPNEEHAYVEMMLDPADRLIVDSSNFDRVEDLVWLREISERTFTAPADLNWVKLEDWRLVTAALFDSPPMRDRLQNIRQLNITAIGGTASQFGDSIESLYYAAWMMAQTGSYEIDCTFSIEPGDDSGALIRVRIGFHDATEAVIVRNLAKGVVTATVDGKTQTFDCVARILGRSTEDLIVRQLKRPEADRVFVRLLPIATQLAAQVKR